MKTKTERYVVSKLTHEKKVELVEELVQWALTVWHSNADDLRSYWMETKSYETVLYMLRTESGQLVGKATIKFYRAEYQGKTINVVKLGLGVDPAFRGDKFALRCLMSELMRLKARHPVEPYYLFSTLIHPVTYKLCCDLLGDRLYPYFKNTDDPQRRSMAEYLAKEFGVAKADSPDPLVYREHFAARENQEAVEYWQRNKRPEVQFFLSHCPTYNTGDCLICLAPIQLTHVLKNMVSTLARNRIDKLRGRKHRFASS